MGLLEQKEDGECGLQWKQGQWDGLAGKMFAAEAESMSLVPGTHMVAGKRCLPQVVIWRMCACIHIYISTKMNNELNMVAHAKGRKIWVWG